MSEQIGRNNSESYPVNLSSEELELKAKIKEAAKRFGLAINFLLTREGNEGFIYRSRDNNGETETLRGRALIGEEKDSEIKIESFENNNVVVTVRDCTSSNLDEEATEGDDNTTIYMLFGEEVTVLEAASLFIVDDRAHNKTLAGLETADATEVENLANDLSIYFEPIKPTSSA